MEDIIWLFTERGEIRSEISKLDDNEVIYQILKIIIKNISSHNIDEKDVDLIDKLIKKIMNLKKLVNWLRK